MERPSKYNFLLLNVAAYVTLLAVAYLILTELHDLRSRAVAIVYFVAFGILVSLFPSTEGHPRRVHAYLACQSLIALGVYLLDPRHTLDVQILFFVLSAQAALFLPTLVASGWIAFFYLATAAGGVSVLGWHAILETLAAGGGYAFFGTFGALLRPADAERKRSQNLLAELQEAHERLRDYAAQTHQLAVAEERNRLARELHDALGHRLTVAVVQLEGAQRLIGSDPNRAAAMVGAMREQLKEALAELRQAVGTLRSPRPDVSEAAPVPLAEALVALAQTFEQATGLTVHVRLPAEFPDIGLPLRHALYRAAQEGLTNVQRHAGARRAWLDVDVEDDRLALTVSDDGRGWPAEVGDARFGLRGLSERAAQLQGRLALEQRPGGGARMRLELPLGDHEMLGLTQERGGSR